MHPVLEEIHRWNALPRIDVFRRIQRQVRDEVGPRLEAVEIQNAELLDANAKLELENAELKGRLAKKRGDA